MFSRRADDYVDEVLAIAEFAYNSSVNRSGLSPFEVVMGYRLRKPIDLPMSIGDRPCAITESVAHHLHELHDHIKRQSAISNDNSKSAADSHKRLQEFAIGDEVMVRVRPERFPM